MLSPVPSASQPLDSPQDAGFVESLRQGLHTLAQPLTLLQTRLEAALLSDEQAAEQLLALLAGDVERACQSFHAMQHLVGRYSDLRSASPADAPGDLS